MFGGESLLSNLGLGGKDAQSGRAQANPFGGAPSASSASGPPLNLPQVCSTPCGQCEVCTYDTMLLLHIQAVSVCMLSARVCAFRSVHPFLHSLCSPELIPRCWKEFLFSTFKRYSGSVFNTPNLYIPPHNVCILIKGVL